MRFIDIPRVLNAGDVMGVLRHHLSICKPLKPSAQLHNALNLEAEDSTK